jgi:hypothetical protein
VNESAVQGAVEKLQLFVGGDGAAIEIAQIDSSSSTVRLRLDLSNVECVECVMPPDVLVEIIEKRIRMADPSVVVVTVADPRIESTI